MHMGVKSVLLNVVLNVVIEKTPTKKKDRIETNSFIVGKWAQNGMFQT